MNEPYKLSDGPHLFVDWRYIQAGTVRWVSKNGHPIDLWGPEGVVGPIHADPVPYNVPRGIRLIAQKAEKTEPFLKPTKPWERMIICYSTIIYEGKYRLWYEVVTPEREDVLCYAESKDGEAWEKPSLGIFKYKNIDTNIVFGKETEFHGGTVFIDPSAPLSERYKIIFVGSRTCSPVFGGVSPDGLHWKQIPEPLVIYGSDTQNTAYYDSQLKKYVWYCRMWVYGRRCVGRAETEDFRKMPMPEMVLWPTPDLPPSVDWYTNAKTLYPGSSDIHLMFPALYNRAEDRTEVYMASSIDGKSWSLVPGGPVLTTGDPGSWDSGCVFAGCGLVPLPNNRVGLVYTGFKVPHKYPRTEPLGAIAYAYWPKGRLAALEAPEIGEFSTIPLLFKGRKLLLNFETKRAGEILVEVANSEGQTLPGRSFSDADPLNGNAFNQSVTWRGEADLGHKTNQPVILRFRMRAAKLFAFEFC